MAEVPQFRSELALVPEKPEDVELLMLERLEKSVALSLQGLLGRKLLPRCPKNFTVYTLAQWL